MNFKTTSWQPNTVYNRGQEILDGNLNIQICENSGQTSGALAPLWGMDTFDPTDDNGVHWRNQGPLTADTPDAWTASHVYPGASKILDPNGNVEIAQLFGGVSGGTMPAWGPNEGDTVMDGSVTWFNLGKVTVFGLNESGGTSGIIIDNMSNLQGASQIYFSTLKDAGCGPNGPGGCAVQASQQDLK